jgi:AhpD family alkylhydroperoxidase
MARRIAYHQVAPDALKSLAATRPYIESSGIEPRLRALVELRVSQVNGCAYCVDLHSREARRAGEAQQRLDCLPVWRETPFFDDRERAALAWAESVTLVPQTGVPDVV